MIYEVTLKNPNQGGDLTTTVRIEDTGHPVQNNIRAIAAARRELGPHDVLRVRRA